MNLSNLRPPKGQKHKKQRIGQGMGTGRGKYSGRGAKGAQLHLRLQHDARLRRRPDAAAPPPAEARVHQHLQERVRHRQFRPAGEAGRRYASTRTACSNSASSRSSATGLKILGTGELTRKITVQAHVFSKSALEKIQKAGGTAQVIGERVQVTDAPRSEVGIHEVFRSHRQYVPRFRTCASGFCSRWDCWPCTAWAATSRRPASTPTGWPSSSSRTQGIAVRLLRPVQRRQCSAG